MSQNDQMLVKKYKNRWYVFNVMAESWSKTNGLPLKRAIGVFKTKGKAFVFADTYDQKQDHPSEYGVSDRLIKDGANVKIVQ